MAPDPKQDLGEVMTLAMEELDRIAEEEGAALPLLFRTRVVYWLARSYDAGRGARRTASTQIAAVIPDKD